MTTLIQRSFASGEIAPALYARVDQARYQTGARTLRNFIVFRHGGAYNRPGSKFIGEVKDSSVSVRLIPFVFNSSQTYCLEFGHEYMRVIRNGGYVTLTPQNITAITNANPCVVTYSGSDTYSNGDEVYISGITGSIGDYLNNRNFKIANVNTTLNTFELKYMDGSTDVDSTSFGSYTSGGTVAEVYTVVSPYDSADIFDLHFIQSRDVVTIVHPSYAPRELTRTDHDNWSFSTITFAPAISAPANVSHNRTAGSTFSWVVTAVASDTFEESLASTATSSSDTPSSGSPTTISWDAVTGAQEYNVYKALNGIYGFIGVAGSTTFIDTGIDPDTTDTPPTARNPFNASDSYPSTVAYIQQRLGFANTNNEPEKIWLSRVGHFKNFTTSQPLQDDDAVTFTLAGRQVNSVRNLLDVGKFVMLTSAGEWTADGDNAGTIKPTAINAKQNAYNGSSSLQPIIVGSSALFVQARGSVVRDLAYDYEADGYRGNDLTIFSSHLFDGHTITDWTFSQVPNSIAWLVRDDGVLLGLTYVKEQQLLAWHRHDFTGEVESVCSIPEGSEDVLYISVKRTINGATKRYVEQIGSRYIDDILDAKFMDSHLTYDGRNTSATTMTLTSSGTWLYTDTLTLTASASYFSSSDVGKQIHLTGSDGEVIRFTIDAYSSATVVTGRPHKTVPTSLQATATLVWSKAISEVSGLWHLEGKQLSTFADGFVVSNPNNSAYNLVTVSNGKAVFDKPYAVIHTGLPKTDDLETLNIDTPTGETIADKKMSYSQVTFFVESSRGIWVGATPPDETIGFLDGLTEAKVRDDEDYDSPISLTTGTIEIIIQPEWNSTGRVFMRQTDPLPVAVLAVAPSGSYPFRG